MPTYRFMKRFLDRGLYSPLATVDGVGETMVPAEFSTAAAVKVSWFAWK